MTEVADGSQIALQAQQQPVSALENGRSEERPEGKPEELELLKQVSSVGAFLDGPLVSPMKGGEADTIVAERQTGCETNSQPVLLEGVADADIVGEQEVGNGGDTENPKSDDPRMLEHENIKVDNGDTDAEVNPSPEPKELEGEKMNMKESEVEEQNINVVNVDKAGEEYESINVHNTQVEEVEGKEKKSEDAKLIEAFGDSSMCKEAPVESGTEMVETASGLVEDESHKGVAVDEEKMNNKEVAHTHEGLTTIASKVAGGMATKPGDKIADRMVDEMAERLADEMAAELADELAEEMVDEVIEADNENAEEGQELGTENMDDSPINEAGEMEEEEEQEEEQEKEQEEEQEEEQEGEHKEIQGDNAEGTAEEQVEFVEELEHFFKQRNMEYKPPKFYGLELNVLKLWRVVTRLGGHDHVTASKLWRRVGEEFKPPKTCTTISWSFRGFYEKALLDYERYKTGVPGSGNSHRPGQMDSSFLQMDAQGTGSPATPTANASPGGVSSSGRARRDAAARAMQGWHSQRTGNGDAKDTSEKGSGGKHTKKEKKLTSIAGTGVKRKGASTVLERAVKAVRAQGRPRLTEQSPPSNSAVANTGKRSLKHDSVRHPVKAKQNDGIVTAFEPHIVDEGPKADWVKINVHKHVDCFEIYALVPGLAREEVRIQCEPGGRLVIAGMPEDPDNPWGVTPFRKVITLPSRINAHQTSAVVTLYGQLYVRVPIADIKSP